ncbi:MAG TPA: metalloregulator ArsR/SmtB family transcription factor [Gemmatimonadota bacterium]|nr:metalloregulator ArsR/SmtB family transcription factor [Gemmatimonadota bacterium]
MNAYESSLHALADPTRRTIFDLVRERPRSVGELAAKLPVSRPAVSQHLGVLARARLVRHRKRGTRHVYHPDPAGLAPLRAYVESLWDDVLAAFAASGEGNGGSENARDEE